MKKYKRVSKAQKIKVFKSLKEKTPNIVFKAKNLVVTLKSKSQLKFWLKNYPDGKYVIN